MAHIKERANKNGGLTHVVCWRDPEGRFREKSFRLIKDAKAHKSRVEADLDRDQYQDDRKGRLTFAEVADEWIAARESTERTAQEKARVMRTRILPTFGHRRVSNITPGDCAAFKNKLKAEGLRPSTIQKVRPSALNHGVRGGGWVHPKKPGEGRAHQVAR